MIDKIMTLTTPMFQILRNVDVRNISFDYEDLK